jgi:hypothetical protein
MANTKQSKTRNQSLILKDLCTHLRMPNARMGNAKMLLMFLGNVTRPSGKSWYSYESITRSTGMSATSIGRSTKYLISLGWLEYERGSYSRSNRYTLQKKALAGALRAQNKLDGRTAGTPEVDIDSDKEGTPEVDISTPETDKGTPETDKGTPETTIELVIRATGHDSTGHKATGQRQPASTFLEKESEDSLSIHSSRRPVEERIAAAAAAKSVNEIKISELRQEIKLFGQDYRRMHLGEMLYRENFEAELKALLAAQPNLTGKDGHSAM